MTGRRRNLALAALVAVVVGVHGCVANGVAERLADAGAAAAMPPRIAVAYVREMQAEAPPAAAPRPAPPRAAPRERAAREPAAALTMAAVAASAASAAAAAASAASASAAAASAAAASAAAASAAATADAAATLPPEVMAHADAPSAAASAVEPSASSANAGPALASAVEAAKAADAASPSAPSPAASATSLRPGPPVAGDRPDSSAPSAPVAAAQAASAAVSPAVSAAAQRFAWPASTRLRYVLTGNYRGEINGSAEVEWVRQGERYQTHVDVVVGLPFAPLLTRRMGSEGRLGATGLVPERYDEDSKVAFRERRRVSMRFEPDGVVMADGRRLPTLPGVQDTASQFIQLTWMFTVQPSLLAPGRTVELPLALPRNIDRWVYDVLQPETLNTPFGAVDTFHLRPRRPDRPEGQGRDLTAELWFAPSYRYLPLRIRIRQDAETYIDLMVERPPQLE